MNQYRVPSSNKKLFTAHSFLIFLLCVVWFVFTPKTLWSQQPFNSPVEGVLGKSGATDQTPWSFFSNSAGLASLENPFVGIGYASDFHLKELGHRTLFAALPTKWLVVGGGFVHQGFEHFNYQKYSLSASRQMAPWLNLSIRPNLTVRHQTGIEDRTIFTLDAGLQFKPYNQVRIGFYANNPAQAQWTFYDVENEYYPTVVSAALSYSPSTHVDMELGVMKQNLEPIHLSFGMSAPIHEHIVLRGAASSAPIRLALGVGLLWQGFTFDMGMNYHSSLGISSAFGIIYSLSTVEK